VLEGLRRLDENIAPSIAFPSDFVPEPDELETAPVESSSTSSEVETSSAPAFFSFVGKESMSRRKPLVIGAIAVAVVASVAVIGVPAGWYSSKKAAAAPAENTSQAPAPVSSQPEVAAQPQPVTSEPTPTTEDAAALAAKRQREKERKAREAKNAENPGTVASAPESIKPGAKRVVVTVTYDESGRVTQASGGDANALRIARQKRFPPGKAGSATVSIPIN
jgi:type IV secretory pathway VirB10-like protein